MNSLFALEFVLLLPQSSVVTGTTCLNHKAQQDILSELLLYCLAFLSWCLTLGTIKTEEQSVTFVALYGPSSLSFFVWFGF